VSEPLRLHRNMSADQARKEAIALLDRVGIPDAARRIDAYPHQFSGGQRQRITIAMALACGPDLLIADEPTTALDVTIQRQILDLIRQPVAEPGMGPMLISHDLGALASVSQRIAVFYAGRIVESGPAEQVLREPEMPYTKALLSALPTVGKTRLEAISGQPPDLSNLPVGCAFAPRCTSRFEKCEAEPGLLVAEPGHEAACWLVNR